MVGPGFAQGSQFTKIKHRKVLKLIMAGDSFQIQIRHIQVAKKDVADLLVETVGATKAGVAQVQLLMKLAGKYSNCRSKEDGGNLGWVEMGWNPEDPRIPRGGFRKLENEELHDIICQALEKKEIEQGLVFGPVQTKQGYHAVIISNEFKTDRIL